MYLFLHRQHRGEVVGLAFSPDGEFMYSADSQGSLALYNSSEEEHCVIKVVCMYTNNHFKLFLVHHMLPISRTFLQTQHQMGITHCAITCTV